MSIIAFIQFVRQTIKSKKHLYFGILLVLLAGILLYYSLGLPFSWKWQTWIHSPTWADYGLLSLLVFIGPGALLYKLGFYRALHQLLGSSGLYGLFKFATWLAMVVIVLVLIWAIVWFANLMINLFYNGLIIVIIAIPSILIAFLLLVIINYSNQKINKSH
ncbi:MAG: hypothetical protein OXF49_03450 [Candidatus Saccharibacteria bacterium]|nr:hypothetical protein [Candidatus Saccharibacteria bacterium]